MLDRFCPIAQIKFCFFIGPELQSVQDVQSCAIDWYWNESIGTYISKNSVLVAAPFGEPRKIGRNVVGISVEYMWPVAMHQYAGVVFFIEGVSADMWSAVNDEDFFVQSSCEAFSQNRACKSSANN